MTPITKTRFLFGALPKVWTAAFALLLIAQSACGPSLRNAGSRGSVDHRLAGTASSEVRDLAKARRLLAENALEEAKSELEPLKSNGGTELEARRLLCRIHVLQGRYDLTMRELSIIQERFPADEETRFLLQLYGDAFSIARGMRLSGNVIHGKARSSAERLQPILVGPWMNTGPSFSRQKSTALVVLGAALVDGKEISDRLRSRLDKTLSLARDFPQTKIVAVGGGKGKVKEADVMADWLITQGIDESRILRERESLDTYGNAALSLPLCHEQGFEHIVIVTDEAHIRRAVAL